MSVERPEHGARFSFELLEVLEAGARYRVIIGGPGNDARGEALVRPAGEAGLGAVELGALEGAIEPWAHKSTVAFLETISRGFDAEAGWPRLLTRWRAARG